MGLLPSCEELDNTGLRVTDKKGMLASSGEGLKMAVFGIIYWFATLR